MSENFWQPKFKKIVSVLLFTLSFLTYGQDRSFEYIKYGTREGLPSSEAYEIIQDKSGNMWFSTDAGVSRFNGYEFENFSTNDGLTDNTVFHMYEDFKGRIWFLTLNHLLCYFENETITAYKYNHKLPDFAENNHIRSISIDSNETLTFVNRRFGIGSITKYGVFDYQSTIEATHGEIGYYQDGPDLLVYGLQSSNKGNSVDLFHFSNQTDSFDFGAKYKHSLYQFQISDQEFLFTVFGYIGHKTKNGFDIKKLTSRNHCITTVCVDSQGRVWVAFFGKGIKIYKNIDDALNRAQTLEKIFGDKNISNVYEDNSGGIWIAVQNSGIYYIPNTNIVVQTLGDDELTNRVSSLNKTEEGVMSVTTSNRKVFELNSEQLSKSPASSLHSLQYFDALNFIEKKNGVDLSYATRIITTQNGLTISSSKWHLTIEKGEHKIYANFELRLSQVLEDRDGTIWIATNSGLFKYENRQLIKMSFKSYLFDSRIEDIHQLKDGTLVFASKSQGVIFWKGDKITNITEFDGLTSNIVKHLFIDDDEIIWASTPNGLNRLVKLRNNRYDILKITEHHGLPSREVNAVNGVGNMIWVATNDGIAIFNKKDIKRNLRTPILRIDAILINDKKVELQSSYALVYHHNHVQINFTGISFQSQGKSLYRYRMIGISDDWIVSEARNVNYYSLMDGSYLFEIQSANEDGVWSKSKKIRFKIAPPFWKTWWFISIIGFFAITFIIIVFRIKAIKIEKKQEQIRLLDKEKLLRINSELKALRSQMNPHFTFNTLSAIQRAVNHSDKETASKYIGSFADLIRKVLDNSTFSYIILHEELAMIQLYAELEQFRFSNKFSFELEIEIEDQLDTSYYKIPSMVIQPYIENAILHGLSTAQNKNGLLKLQISSDDNFIYIIISDNGIGRKKAIELKNKKGLIHNSIAMKNTEERIELYRKGTGKEYSIEIEDLELDGLPAGTRVKLKFPH